MELHEGELRLESIVDQGTTVTVTFPKGRVKPLNSKDSKEDKNAEIDNIQSAG